jgi:hypothetical protein
MAGGEGKSSPVEQSSSGGLTKLPGAILNVEA